MRYDDGCAQGGSKSESRLSCRWERVSSKHPIRERGRLCRRFLLHWRYRRWRGLRQASGVGLWPEIRLSPHGPRCFGVSGSLAGTLGLQTVLLAEAGAELGAFRRPYDIVRAAVGHEALHQGGHLAPALLDPRSLALDPALGLAVLVADAGLDAGVVLHGEKWHHALLPPRIGVGLGHFALD